MHPHRRRKKRPNYGIRTVEVERGPNGFGFTISGQQPCILSCIVANSPADQAGLRAGDFLISVNGLSVSKITHDAVVKLIGNSVGPIKMSIAEYYYSDSSDEELEGSRIINNRKPKYMHKPRTNRAHKSEILNSLCENAACKPKELSPKKNVKMHDYNKVVHDCRFDENAASSSAMNNVQIEEQGPNLIEYKALVGYLGTIEMPKELLPSSRYQTVCSCIRKLRQEKRTPSAVLMTVLPSCLTLKNANGQILAIFPASRVVYISSSSDKESRYFGLVTSAISENHSSEQPQSRYMWQNNHFPPNNPNANKGSEKAVEVEISNSCHVFVTDVKLVEHSAHTKKAETFKLVCTPDIITGNCLEFPKNAMYVVSLVQNMYRLQDCEHKNNNLMRLNNIDEGPLVANSPQPSASSNSDSGIGFRDDCGNVSDRILVVEFPAHRPMPIISHASHRPSAIDGSNIPLDSLELSADAPPYVRAKSVPKPKEEGIAKKRTGHDWASRLTVRPLPEPIRTHVSRSLSPLSADEVCRNADIDTGQIFTERAVDVPEQVINKNDDVPGFKTSVDNVSLHSAKSFESNAAKHVFKAPSVKYIDEKASNSKRAIKLNSCENLLHYKMTPKVYAVAKPNLSCEQLNNLDNNDKCGFGSLQDLSSWTVQGGRCRTAAVSEPDVRLQRDVSSSLHPDMVSTNTKILQFSTLQVLFSLFCYLK